MLYPLDNGNAQKSALLMLAFVSNSSSAVSLAVLILASVLMRPVSVRLLSGHFRRLNKHAYLENKPVKK